MNAIEVNNLVKRFGDKAAVDDVSMTVAVGEIAGFLGPNGSGKTTTLRVMCGLLTPDSGTGQVLGHNILTEADRIKRQVGYMTQRFSFYEDLTIEENLNFVAQLYAMRPVRAAVNETLDSLGLTARRSQLAGTLSGGWKQRMALAACLMHKPKLLLLDEPTAGVDPKARREFWDEIHQRAESGLTVLVSTHYMDEAERCHRISYISAGKLITSGTVSDVLARADLATWVLDGAAISQAARKLEGMAGVDQIAAFGRTLHVVGQDHVALAASVAAVSHETGVAASKGATSLEDVFIQYIGRKAEP